MTYDDLPADARSFIGETLSDAIPGKHSMSDDGSIDQYNIVPPWEIDILLRDDGSHWIEYWEGVDYQSYPPTRYEPGFTGWTDMDMLWEGTAYQENKL